MQNKRASLRGWGRERFSRWCRNADRAPSRTPSGSPPFSGAVASRLANPAAVPEHARVATGGVRDVAPARITDRVTRSWTGGRRLSDEGPNQEPDSSLPAAAGQREPRGPGGDPKVRVALSAEPPSDRPGMARVRGPNPKQRQPSSSARIATSELRAPALPRRIGSAEDYLSAPALLRGTERVTIAADDGHILMIEDAEHLAAMVSECRVSSGLR